MSTEDGSLETLRTLREQEVEGAEAQLREAHDAEQRAEAAVRDAETALREHDAASARERVAEGKVQAWTLAADFASAQRARREELRRVLEGVRAELRNAERAREDARQHLAAARAALEAVERHLSRAAAERARLGERKAEDEQDERNAFAHFDPEG